jgi:NAD(P) transhydrogenase subunit alpha
MTDSTQQLLDKARAAAEAARQLADQAQHYSDELAQTAAAAASHGLGGGAIDPVVFRLAIFALAVDSGSDWARWLGFIALILACVNIFGGFLVTERMLAMYKKKG